MDKGIYCLVLRNPGCTVTVGALGPVMFAAGWYIYVGSALGTGGLARLERHIALAARCDKKPKWHIDYLLTSGNFTLRYAIAAVTAIPLECDLADAIGGESIPAFGCSDCACNSHLFFRENDPRRELEKACRTLGLTPATTTLMSRKRSKGYL
jgi:Uri superfamily endonuclease